MGGYIGIFEDTPAEKAMKEAEDQADMLAAEEEEMRKREEQELRRQQELAMSSSGRYSKQEQSSNLLG
jgi:hypothetical protein